MPTARIVSLLPSATEIVGALGLADQLVGVTHECDVCPDAAGMRRVIECGALRVTVSDIDPHTMTQAAIDRAVKTSLSRGLSLYGLREDVLIRVRPSVVLTQALCSVCAPAYDDVRQLCQQLAAELALGSDAPPEVVNLEPATLADVAETFVTVATACGVPERGVALKRAFEQKLDDVRAVTAGVARPRVLLLEWLEPPFNAGHWVPEQIEAAGGEPVTGTSAGKSKQLSWDEIEAADPDVIVVACCGFDLARNSADLAALLADTSGAEASRRFRALRAVSAGRLYALDGNRYYARPAPSLAEGALVLARVIHAGNPKLVERLGNLGFLPAEGVAWARARVPSGPAGARASQSDPSQVGFGVLHDQACALGQLTYTDPDTGYRVFTRLGLERRGTCCGCGCRHCPYGHANVVDKAARIQEPAFLHRSTRSSQREPTRHVLFWSGGKDSLLALRAWLRAERDVESSAQERAIASLTLLTTFDAKTRVVAHQEVNIADVQRQARALDLDLLGVPLHPGMEYVGRVQSALERLTSDGARVESLIFGDLHLEHVRAWRDSALGGLGHRLEYPLWQVSEQALLDDLVTSGVPCVLSACPGKPLESAVVGVEVGRPFDAQLALAVRRAGWDAFGENGEFHTLAQVWLTSRERALGIGPATAG